MIKANELRLGNWFITSSSKLEKVKTIDTSCMPLINSWLTEAQGYPIPLTLEILKGLGFNETFGGFCQGPEKFNIDYSPTNKTFKIGGNSKTIYLEYVHQLQNAFFLNTGQELNFNLKAFGTADSGT